ncbi:hypothetical protein D9757_013615 [Collybiopsis confluens]|uniref:Peptidyl-prolyl cis-trans isomerase n=1 Tax=Collybiopsis confluens TaxID=2823264 RepID=A0A8H5D0E8_9AGAR|nr:hypothetical protein D9757_013615 [Collybiopsis confluens]
MRLIGLESSSIFRFKDSPPDVLSSSCTTILLPKLAGTFVNLLRAKMASVTQVASSIEFFLNLCYKEGILLLTMGLEVTRFMVLDLAVSGRNQCFLLLESPIRMPGQMKVFEFLTLNPASFLWPVQDRTQTFFITTVPTKWLDGLHVVFGEVVEGMDVVKEIEAQGSSTGRPVRQVSIVRSGTIAA